MISTKSQINLQILSLALITVGVITSGSTSSALDTITATTLTEGQINQASPVLVFRARHNRSGSAPSCTAREGVSTNGFSTVITNIHCSRGLNPSAELVSGQGGDWHY